MQTSFPLCSSTVSNSFEQWSTMKTTAFFLSDCCMLGEFITIFLCFTNTCCSVAHTDTTSFFSSAINISSVFWQIQKTIYQVQNKSQNVKNKSFSCFLMVTFSQLLIHYSGSGLFPSFVITLHTTSYICQILLLNAYCFELFLSRLICQKDKIVSGTKILSSRHSWNHINHCFQCIAMLGPKQIWTDLVCWGFSFPNL